MMKRVVEIKNLSKEYQLGVIGRDTFYRDFQSFVSRMMNKEDPNSNLNDNSLISQKKFLALKNVNLNIDEGEVVGVPAEEVPSHKPSAVSSSSKVSPGKPSTSTASSSRLTGAISDKR